MIHRRRPRRLVQVTTFLAVATSIAIVVSASGPIEGEALAQRPKAKTSAAPAAPSTPRGQIGRKPTSGSCDNTDNTCSGQGESCIDNLCFCTEAGFARCRKDPDARNCTYIAGDIDNCGACGKKCRSDQMCEKGKCVAVKCDDGETSCRVGCRDLKTSDDACGSCNNRCKWNLGFHCANGVCRR